MLVNWPVAIQEDGQTARVYTASAGGAENARPENDGPRKLQGLKMQPVGPENAGPVHFKACKKATVN